MSFFQHNIVAFLVTLVAGAYAWVWGGTMSSWMITVTPWTWALLLEGMFLFPQRREGETTPAARQRVVRDLRRDPCTWAVVLFLVMLLIPFLNTALCPVCDARAIAEGADPGPFVRFLPFCANRYEQLVVFLWFAPSLTAALAVRHALAKEGQRQVILLLVVNAVLLAIFGFIENATGARAPFWVNPGASSVVFFASFGYSNMAADYFMVMTFLALAVWRRRLDEDPGHLHRNDHHGVGLSVRYLANRHWPLGAACLLFAATLATLSRAGILLVTFGSAILVLHALMSYFAHLDRLGRVRAGAFFLLAFALLAVFVMSALPTGVRKELDTVRAVDALDRVSGRGEFHGDVSLALLKEHPLFGCGGWGYRHFSYPFLPESTRKALRYGPLVGGANVHNDHMQFMVEHGIAGYAVLVFIVALLLSSLGGTWRRLAKAARFARGSKRPPPPVSLFALPAPAFSILVAAAATLIHAFGDCPLRSPAVLSVFFIELAALDGYLPHFEEAEESESTHHKED